MSLGFSRILDELAVAEAELSMRVFGDFLFVGYEDYREALVVEGRKQIHDFI